MRLFIDETAWIQLMNPELEHHNAISREFNRALSEGDKLFTHNVAIGLAVSEVRKTRGYPLASKFGEIIDAAYTGAHLSILWIGRRTQKEAAWILRKHSELPLDFFDFAAVVLMKRRRIRTIMTTKSAYKKLEMTVIPEPGES